MTMKKPADKATGAAQAFRTALKSQYHAALAMFRQAVDLYPDEAWRSEEHTTVVWQLAYHTLFFAHLYMQPTEADFEPFEDHQSQVQYPDGIPGPPDPDSALPLAPEPYTKAQVLSYWKVCDAMVDEAVDRIDLFSPESGFHWYKVPKLEHQIINIRHIQHGAAQIADRLRATAGIGIDWVGARRTQDPRSAR